MVLLASTDYIDFTFCFWVVNHSNSHLRRSDFKLFNSNQINSFGKMGPFKTVKKMNLALSTRTLPQIQSAVFWNSSKIHF